MSRAFSSAAVISAMLSFGCSGTSPRAASGPGDAGNSGGGGSGGGASNAGGTSMGGGKGGTGGAAPQVDPPVLAAGVWTNITPAGLDITCCPGTGGVSFGIAQMAVDPSNPNIIYFAVDLLGLYKTTDRGSTWRRLGDPSKAGADTTGYLDSPGRVSVDPADSQHLYAMQGVRGQTQGFWISRDGGETWALPRGFIEAVKTTGTRDVTTLAIDPTDFNHVLLGSHQAWRGIGNAGVLESKNGGETFVIHQPRPSWNVGSIGIEFMMSPDGSLGNPQTWLVGTESDGLWRTTNGGGSWSKVSDNGIPHGGIDCYYTKTNVVYCGAAGYPVRSRDNGASWEQLMNGVPYAYYYTVGGDGKTLYTMLSGTGNSGRDPTTYVVSPETDGARWVPQSGNQKLPNGPFEMHYDPTNKIMYSSNWSAGIWAMKVE